MSCSFIEKKDEKLLCYKIRQFMTRQHHNNHTISNSTQLIIFEI
jgi:hypothetical protein